MELSTSLPPLYTLETLDTTESATSQAALRARQGADEGTLVWVRGLRGTDGDEGARGIDLPDHLDCALVIRPEYPATISLQLNFVAAVSAGAALAALIAPLTELHYQWPNAVLLNRARIGHVQLRASPLKNDHLEWLVVGLALNLRAPVAEYEHESTSVCATGAADINAVAVLEGFARHFLSWINRWAAQGFEPVRKHWLQRALGVGESVSLSLQQENIIATLTQIDEGGSAHLRLSSGTQRTLTVAEFYGVVPA